MTRHIQYIFLTTALLWSAMTPARASDCTIPNTFAAGTPAVAAEMNANFASIETAVDDNHTRIAALQASVAALQTEITTLQTENTQLQNGHAALSSSLSAVENNSVMALDGILTFTADNSGYDTALFTGVNLRIVNGSGATDGTTDGTGNLIVGYNEKMTGVETPRSGSHNVVIGVLHAYSAYGGLVAGAGNTISGAYSTVSGGLGNAASGDNSNVIGGTGNTASGYVSSITGGNGNEAGNTCDSVSGGLGNTCSGGYGIVTGGIGNQVTGSRSIVSGGAENLAEGGKTSISAGRQNTAVGVGSSITGGSSNRTVTIYSGIGACNGCVTDLTYYDFEAQNVE